MVRLTCTRWGQSGVQFGPQPASPFLDLFMKGLRPTTEAFDVVDGLAGTQLQLLDAIHTEISNRARPRIRRGSGMAGTLPTATDDAVGGDQWRLGPDFLAASSGPGALLAHWQVTNGM